MSDTPRTAALEATFIELDTDAEVAFRDLARTLERENAALRADGERLAEQIRRDNTDISDLRAELSNARLRDGCALVPTAPLRRILDGIESTCSWCDGKAHICANTPECNIYQVRYAIDAALKEKA